MPPKKRVGARQAKYRPSETGIGRINRHKLAWVHTQPTQQLALSVKDPAQYDEDREIPEQYKSEPGISYILYFNRGPGRQPFYWNLTNLTGAELEALKEFFSYAFSLADPVIRERDKVAHEAFKQGDDSYTRVYRPVPTLVIRERTSGEDGEGLRNGPDGPVDGAGNDLDPDGRVRGSRDELADGEPSEGVSEDDEPQAD